MLNGYPKGRIKQLARGRYPPLTPFFLSPATLGSNSPVLAISATIPDVIKPNCITRLLARKNRLCFSQLYMY